MAARRMGIICLLCCLCLSLLPCPALAVSTADASEPISTEQNCSLTLSFLCNGTAITELPVKLYKIAEVSGLAQYTLAAPFRSTGLILNGIQSTEEWNTIRTTLEAHIVANNLQADSAAVTDSSGIVCFKSLKPGLYMAGAVQATQNNLHCSFDSALIALPGLDEDGNWQYQVAARPKPEIIPPVTPDEEIQLKVLKLWKDKKNQTKRPDHIDVEIFREGKSHKIVTLSEENNWSHTWTAPADNADWVVVERNIPEGYSVTVEERTTAFILTNTYTPEETPKDNPSKDTPKTADASHILTYILLMYGSGMILILLWPTKKRRRA